MPEGGSMQRELLLALLCLVGSTTACSGGNGAGPLKSDRGAMGNHPPTISGVPATVAVIDDFYSFTPSAQDPERRPLTFSISNKPAWASFSANTGKLSGMPESSQIGSHV